MLAAIESGGVELTTSDDPGGDIQALRERLSKLSEASLRICESLDVDTVLREVVESARALTGAGCSGITTMDASGHLQDFVTAGVSPEDYQRFLHLPHGPGLWEYLRQVPQPLRLRDLAAHLGPLGFPDDPALARSFLGTPIRHRGVQVGNFFLADKAGGQAFTREDEEVLAPFAAQAGAAIANAREHRDEQRARADLEVLIDTSPVGVVVFDARSGQVMSLNRESRRIVGDRGTPGCSAAELLEGLRVRLADGREILLEESALRQMLARGGDGSRRGDRPGVSRRPAGDHAGQRHAHRLGDGRGGVAHRHAAGHDAGGGARAAAGPVPRHGEPRVAGPADLDQGLRGHGAGDPRDAGPGRDGAVVPHHRRAGRSDARADQRPA